MACHLHEVLTRTSMPRGDHPFSTQPWGRCRGGRSVGAGLAGAGAAAAPDTLCHGVLPRPRFEPPHWHLVRSARSIEVVAEDGDELAYHAFRRRRRFDVPSRATTTV